MKQFSTVKIVAFASTETENKTIETLICVYVQARLQHHLSQIWIQFQYLICCVSIHISNVPSICEVFTKCSLLFN